MSRYDDTGDAEHMTVARLRAALDRYPDNLPVVIWDADTDWLLPLAQVISENDLDEPEGADSTPRVVLRSVGYS